MMIFLLVLLQVNVPDAATFVGQPQGTALAGAELSRRTAEVAALVRCPVCQGMSVADSPAEMAVNMKGQVRELLARGYTEEQILKYFERSYGQFVLLRPKFEGVTAAVWLLPFIGLIVGAAVIFRKMRRPVARPVAAVAAVAAESDAISDPYLTRVRALVTGKNS